MGPPHRVAHRQRGRGGAADRELVHTYDWQVNDRLAGIDDSLLGRTRYQHDTVSNLFRTIARTDHRCGPAGQLAGKTLPTGAQWHYRWHAAGHLAEVVRPDGGAVRFTYDALLFRSSIQRLLGQGKTEFLTSGQLPLPPDVSQVPKVVREDSQKAPAKTRKRKLRWRGWLC